MMDDDEERIMHKAYELWEAEGRPHGRDREHWDQAKEIVALHDSAGSALLPRETGAEEPIESKVAAIDNEGQAPGLTDTGEHDLTATDREPAITAPPAAAVAPPAAAPPAAAPAKKAVAKRVPAPADLAKSGDLPAKTKSAAKKKGR